MGKWESGMGRLVTRRLDVRPAKLVLLLRLPHIHQGRTRVGNLGDRYNLAWQRPQESFGKSMAAKSTLGFWLRPPSLRFLVAEIHSFPIPIPGSATPRGSEPSRAKSGHWEFLFWPWSNIWDLCAESRAGYSSIDPCFINFGGWAGFRHRLFNL